MSRVSIVLPYKNAARTLRDAARSIVSDMRPAEDGRDDGDELVMVDDGSADDGPAIAAEVRAEAAALPRRKSVVLVSSGGVGIAGALQRGVEASRGDYIARMDGDDESLPTRLRKEAALLDADPSLGAVATKIELFEAPGEGIQRYAEWQNGLLTAEDHARAIFIESPICHPSSMIRRRALDEIGGYRDGAFAEDYDLWLRLDAAGWGIAKVDEVLFRWRIHKASLTWTDPRFSPEAMRRLRASHLAKRIDRAYGVWGAGPSGRRLVRELEVHAKRTSFFIDIDPKKIGRTARGVPILDPESGMARARASHALLVVAVAARGARDLVRGELGRAGFDEGRDYVCAI